jgi:ABC-type histidine transport system ATPase subunit
MSSFIKPNFKDKSLELRYENNEVCIYGTEEGLRKLSDLVLNLIEKPKQGHIHLEDYEILTDGSLIGAVAIFDKEGNPK